MAGDAALRNGVWAAAAAPAALRLLTATRRTAQTQERLLLAAVRRDEGTDFGRRHGFRRIRSVADFRAAVPVRGWEEFAEWIHAVRRGTHRVLAAEPVERLVPTGGTSGGAKLIPYTAALRREFRRAVDPWIASLFVRHPRALLGRSYWSISPPMAEVPRALPGGPAVGFDDDREYLGPLGRLIFDGLRVVPAAVAAVTDGEDFRYVTARFLLAASDLALISVWHPSFLSVLLDAAVLWSGRLLDDLRDGTLRPPGGLPSALGRELGRGLRPDPQRAAALRSPLGARPTAWERVWPRLAVVSCWTDAAAAGPAAALAARLPGVAVEAKGLVATEGIVSVPWGRAGVPALAVGSHFFEFIEIDPGGDREGRPLLAEELEIGRGYAVVLTTGGGLWRYRLGDLVQVVGRAATCPLLRFLGRERGVVDLTGEKLHECHVSRVLAAAAQRLGVRARFSMLAPGPPELPGGAPRYVWYVEPDSPASAASWRGAAQALEAGLGENPHYRHSRNMGQLGAARVFRIERCGEEAFLSARVSGGQRAGDVKPAALDRAGDWHRRFSGELLEER